MAITVTHKKEGDETSPAMFGEHELLEYSNKVNFPELVFESLTGTAPIPAQAKIFSLILNLCFDHGPGSPSATATIAATKEGKSMGEAVGAGIAEINDRHGGAGEPLMKILYDVHAGKADIKGIVEHYAQEGKRMPGFGHRVYKDVDPRAQMLLNVARENNVGAGFIDELEKLHHELNAQLGKNLPINIDGAIAATLCSLGIYPEVGKAVFIIARAAGLCAHFLNSGEMKNGVSSSA
ncbi:MAG: Citrate synthase [Candidatus Kaiserbacteria bacterium GW2011_GWB1_52_6]|uniref:citrate synthase (unknown stereospecificity) n=2 Tax=Candidatus Kaiseribacteriota TaxID=1752734 RepID=A0A0G1XKY9_9BACT|nr:MAG: Citrate synthase [Candidatus Kaiserbacteria bacterium GW2011_GWB1_52_6]KKW31561.1 MAG: Citrate synthase [Candidatus Kaiserbacteria bacterium GW2011_GWC2_52_8b]